ncbi:N-acetyl-1-D-myo-inositol-2-amino-2-deoxy-alpha-D-glucopyranoside deacetylase [Nonomuraea endophytica]|uniref:1D-myo-inositol 2-acetamido-2-deoxy-alpha-D-glucopyranoside deacetylase n=1 Tax=Nonomuraea endophytica TaxID=714136 RepID=A0A7W8A7A6_9ACTN|nr:N-acetyl-1-D-myo-inositol-2-amino-2-deoxy-alpha-D-glucopyranoside deacetylase [Nonomuraea endophytica]MBB5080941.1 N-acetyl-1-D-myo-inositol-2-amino-2-deoxy-alpha-D-glucopyranoside deacetylase [Nonomuraea endophytica]
MTDRRLLLVHAHPDDETINTGAAMARYVAEGAHVTLVTCTLGEEGEVIPPELAHLEGDPELGEYRAKELVEALRALGVDDHRYLGYRDSGMMGAASNDDASAFWGADVDEAAARLVTVIREVRPQVLVTYDANGYYGHPDHIQAHRVSVRAFDLAADPAFRPEDGEPWQVAKFYFTATAKSVMRRDAEALADSGTGFLVEDPGDLPFGSADDEITTEVDARPWLVNKLDAMRAHATQITVKAPFFALSNNIGQRAAGVEHFILYRGAMGKAIPGAPVEAGGIGEPYTRENDLFSGID